MDNKFDPMLQSLTVNFNNQPIEGTGRLLHDTEPSTVYCFRHETLRLLTNPALPSRFLIKICNDEECFHREQQALHRLAPLQSKLVPKLYGEIQVPRFEGKRALAMQYFNGGTLLSAIATRKLTKEADLNNLQEAISKAFATLTAYHVKHNDGALRNLMIEENGLGERKLFVIDFGDARLCTGMLDVCNCQMDPADRQKCGGGDDACCACTLWECKCGIDCACGEDCECRKCECERWNKMDEKVVNTELWETAAKAGRGNCYNLWEHRAAIRVVAEMDLFGES